MVEIPEHLLKRSREAKAKAKAKKGEVIEPSEDTGSEEPAPAGPAPAEEAVEVEKTPSAESAEVTAQAEEGTAPSYLEPQGEIAGVSPTGPGAGASAVSVADSTGPEVADIQEVLSGAAGYPPDDLIDSGAGIKEVASSRAPGWLIMAFVVIPIISMLYLTQFSHGVQCGQAGTLQVGSDGQLQSCDGKPLPSPGTGGGKQQGPNGAEIFAQQCAACHGLNGEGGVGLPLNKNNGTTLLQDFPTAQSQIEFVSKGNQAFPRGWGANNKPPRGVMPAFGNTLSPEEIQAVVQFERSLAGESPPGGS